jgi:hypothetical protein
VNFLQTRNGMLLAFAVAIWLLWRGLLKRSRAADSRIYLDDLLIGDDGKMSKPAAVMFGSFIVTSGIMVYLTYMSKLTEGYFTAYLLAWVAPSVTRLITNRPAQPAMASTATATATVTSAASPPAKKKGL